MKKKNKHAQALGKKGGKKRAKTAKRNKLGHFIKN